MSLLCRENINITIELIFSDLIIHYMSDSLCHKLTASLTNHATKSVDEFTQWENVYDLGN